MMRNPIATLFPLAALFACSGTDAIAEASPATTKSFAVTGFHGVDLRGSDDAIVRVGPAFSVRATGPKTVLDNLEVAVRDGELRIGRRKGWTWRGTADARIEVTLPALRSASISGSGEMRVGPVRGSAFAGSVAGSGTLTLERLDVQGVELSIAGSGDIKAAGRAARAQYSSAGSGDIDAAAVTSESLSVSTAGSGGVAARATGSADVSVVGSGDVTIRGTTRCKVSRVGSGDVDCAV
jgi:hypothetical protein